METMQSSRSDVVAERRPYWKKDTAAMDISLLYKIYLSLVCREIHDNRSKKHIKLDE